MNKPRARWALLFLLAAALAATTLVADPSRTPPAQKARTPDPALEGFFRKKAVTIAVTDSGLGGLSVLAEAAARLKTSGTFERADLIFYNALFSAEGGYNSLRTRGEKIAIFQSALGGLEKRYRPDLILVACNTLSALLEDALFVRRTKAPVVGIVSAGVDLMAAALQAEPGASVIIFGTPTTIGEGAHVRGLEARGVAAARIVTQSCPELESFIERDWAGSETELLISGFVEEALQKLPAPRPPVFASLNCTHYGYSLPLWESAFAAAGVKPAGVLNPNARLVDFLVAPGRAGRFPATAVSVRAVSMIEIAPEKREALAGRLARTSPETAAALRAYELVPDLFLWKSGN
jgi:glutamate racemase